MKVTGTVWKFPQDDINTDQIRRKNYAHLPLKEQALRCLETLDPSFAAKVKPSWSSAETSAAARPRRCI